MKNIKLRLLVIFLVFDLAKQTIAMKNENNLKKRKIDAILKNDAYLPNKKQKLDSSNPYALHYACNQNNLDLVQSLIAEGFDINKRIASKIDSEGCKSFYAGYAPLHFAVANENTEIVKLLIKKGAVTTTINDRNNTPFDIAIKQKNVEIIKLLAKYEADINKKNNYGYTPLALAITNKKIENAYLLIALGADCNAQDDNGNTILHQVILNESCNLKENDQKIFFVLLTHLCNKTIKNNNGITTQELLSQKFESTQSLFNEENKEILMEALKKLKKYLPDGKYGKKLTSVLHAS